MSRFPSLSSNVPLYISAGVASACLFAVLRSAHAQRKRNPAEHVVPSPLSTLVPKLSSEELCKVPYPPDLFPGGRDFNTPYGSIRIYEWGPETGRKVLLVHGISTPCLSLGSVAEKLVERGCRVMLFDLFGRGYSDDPSDLPHDSRLYTSQILLAIASSPLPWTGTNGFAVVGYSLGGGIAASFTSTFPNLISSLVLIAPSGLVRESHIAWQSKILYSTEGILPEPLIHALVRKRLSSSSTAPAEVKTEPEAALAAETQQATPAAQQQQQPLFPHHPLADVAAAVQWQLDHHAGFVPAFVSSIRHAPIMAQHAHWAAIGARLTAQKANSADRGAQGTGLWRSKVLLVLGRADSVIVAGEVVADAAACLGPGNLETVLLEAGHDVPISKARDVADAMLRFWGEDVDAAVVPEVEEETGT